MDTEEEGTPWNHWILRRALESVDTEEEGTPWNQWILRRRAQPGISQICHMFMKLLVPYPLAPISTSSWHIIRLWEHAPHSSPLSFYANENLLFTWFPVSVLNSARESECLFCTAMSGTRKVGERGYKVCCDPLPDFKHKKKVTGKLYQLRKE